MRNSSSNNATTSVIIGQISEDRFWQSQVQAKADTTLGFRCLNDHIQSKSYFLLDLNLK